MEIERGDVWFAELSQGGSVQTGNRPVLVIQNNIGNRYSPNVIVIPITSQIKKNKYAHSRSVQIEEQKMVHDTCRADLHNRQGTASIQNREAERIRYEKR